MIGLDWSHWLLAQVSNPRYERGAIMNPNGRPCSLLHVTNGNCDGQEEKERSSAIVEALRQEQSEVEEQQKEVIRQREAQLEAEKEQREALALQLQETKVHPHPMPPPPPRHHHPPSPPSSPCPLLLAPQLPVHPHTPLPVLVNICRPCPPNSPFSITSSMPPIHPCLWHTHSNSLHLPGTASTLVLHVSCKPRVIRRYNNAIPLQMSSVRQLRPYLPRPYPDLRQASAPPLYLCCYTTLLYGVDGG